MKDIVSEEIKGKCINKAIHLIPQSVIDVDEEIFSLKEYFEIPNDSKLIFLSASYRKIKDIGFIF